jgi:hypothetical protein
LTNLCAELLQRLQPVHGSRLLKCVEAGCTARTREAAIQEIDKWAHNTSTMSSVYWIRGKMGTGKTAIARTVADRFHHAEILGSAYFITRDEASVDPRNILRTMAYELAYRFECLRSSICHGIVGLEDLQSSALPDIIHALIAEPLRVLLRDGNPVVLILDGLHHAFRFNGPTMKALMPALVSALPWGTKLLITSLDDGPTELITRSIPRAPNINTLHLYPLDVTLGDMKTFYFHHFGSIIDSHPSTHDREWIAGVISSLAEITGHLFLFAAIVTRYVNAVMHNPYERLKDVMNALQNPSKDMSVVLEPLDIIYRLILDDASIDGHPEIVERLRSMMACIVVAREPMTVQQLATILHIEEGLTATYLDALSSVLLVVSEDLQIYIRPFHPSLRDFLLEPARSTVTWAISAHGTHLQIAHFSLDIMLESLNTVDWMAESLPSIDQTTRLRHLRLFSPGLVYACTHWTFHVASMETLPEETINRIIQFSTTLILPWLAAICAMDRLEEARKGLQLLDIRMLVCSSFLIIGVHLLIQIFIGYDGQSYEPGACNHGD